MESINLSTPQRVRRRQIVATLGILTALILAFLWLWHRDDEAPDDGAFAILTPTPPSETENPLHQFLEQLRALPDDGYEAQTQQLRRNELTTDKAKQVFFESSAVQKRFALWDNLLASDPKTWYWEMQRPASKENSSNQASDLACMLDIVNLQKHRSQHLIQTGELQKAIYLALQLNQLSLNLSSLDGSALDHLVFSSVKTIAHDLLQKIALDQAADERTMEQLEEGMPAAPPFLPVYKKLLKVQYQLLKYDLSKAHAKHILFDNPLEDLGIDHVSQVTGNTIRKNRSLRLYLKHLTRILEASDRGWPEIVKETDQSVETLSRNAKEDWQQLLNPNAAGEKLVAATLDVSNVWNRILSRQIWDEALRVQFALRRYELKHQKLPDRLDLLVPEFIKKLPLDPFASQPLKWNPKTQRLYSIGWNLVDENGQFSKPWSPHEADLGMDYLWSSKAPPEPSNSAKAAR